MWKYCPTCAGQLKDSNTEMYGTCQKCDQPWYKNPKPTIGVYIVKGDNIFLTKRAVDPFKGMWDTPGGFVKEGEHPQDAAKREVMEELGATLTNIEFLGFFGPGHYQFHNFKQINMEIGYTAQLKDESILKAADDVSEYAWFPLNNLPELAFEVTYMGIETLKTKNS